MISTNTRVRLAAVLAVVISGSGAASSSFAASVGPLPYLSAADGPWANAPLAPFYLEDFEDGVLNTPGVSAAGAVAVSVAGDVFTDSVDGDDGAIDGSGRNGRSHYTGNGGSGIEYTFSSAVLGALPTHAGIVWTDLSNAADVFLEAFDGSNASLGILAAGDLNDGVSTSETAEDRFLGWTHPAGILRIRVYQSGSDMEVDHLQYGILVPEPTAWAMIACAGMLAAMKRRTTPSSRTRRE
jgi:hypothetical protein